MEEVIQPALRYRAITDASLALKDRPNLIFVATRLNAIWIALHALKYQVAFQTKEDSAAKHWL